MKGTTFDWDSIVKDSAEIITKSILQENDTITTLNILYTSLEKLYQKKDKKLPTYNTFRQKMHKVLNVARNQKNVKSALYQLAGKYDKMTLNMLAENIYLSSESSANGCNWLFIRLKRHDSDFINTQKHLYYLSQKLKKKFTQEIIFISFDTDTIVVMCSDSNAKNMIFSYLNKNSKCRAIDTAEDN